MKIDQAKRDNVNLIKQDSEEQWKKSIPSFIKMCDLEAESSQVQVDHMPLNKDMTVVDLCCGSGRWAIPIAKKVKQVTVVDNSQEMLDACMERAKNAGLDNIEPVLMNIFDADSGNNIKIHDAVVCSRSVAMRDLAFLSSFASKLAVIGSWGSGPSIRSLRNLIIKDVADNPSPPKEDKKTRDNGYNRYWNEAYDLGFDPNVLIMPDYFKAIYSSKEEAYEDLRVLAMDGIDHEDVYCSNIDKLLFKKDGKLELCLETQTVFMWWALNK